MQVGIVQSRDPPLSMSLRRDYFRGAVETDDSVDTQRSVIRPLGRAGRTQLSSNRASTRRRRHSSMVAKSTRGARLSVSPIVEPQFVQAHGDGPIFFLTLSSLFSQNVGSSTTDRMTQIEAAVTFNQRSVCSGGKKTCTRYTLFINYVVSCGYGFGNASRVTEITMSVSPFWFRLLCR